MPNKPDFYLTSTDSFFEPRACFIQKRIMIEGKTNDILVVRISPNIIGQPYGLGGNNIDYVALSVRFAGSTLFPINEWPMYVHVYRIINDDFMNLTKISPNEIQRIIWGELYETQDEASSVTERFKMQVNQNI